MSSPPDAGVRGRKPSPLLELRRELPAASRTVLAAVGVSAIALGWTVVAAWQPTLVPTPAATLRALLSQAREGELATDLAQSLTRIAIGYSISVAIGVLVGVAMGTLRSAESLLEAPIGLMRYIPATALTPLLLLWLGIDEAPKIALIVLGSVFFNVLMVADVARAVPIELIEASYTLGARRLRVLTRVVFRHSLPGIVDVARINLAAGWLMLVVAELLAAQGGLAFRIQRAYRFRQVDVQFAMLAVIAIIGVVSDLALRWLRNTSSPWARS